MSSEFGTRQQYGSGPKVSVFIFRVWCPLAQLLELAEMSNLRPIIHLFLCVVWVLFRRCLTVCLNFVCVFLFVAAESSATRLSGEDLRNPR